ncbi:cell division protein FtsI (penicillin-binding protein 3) [Frondihabitans australicus]|uniref:Cell division protein FtsI (Penicillin-binding protein 3) n=1 Tax=Frondihabitans australicus TaxID=386892 RepID=A0A495IE99_9MICO|nr:cell division protein FtsI (penicillin-binding protein 3) [Frondihabitans australicus]
MSIVAAAILVLVALFVVRLIDIQVVQAATLNADAVGKRSITSPIYGDRGTIVDTNGKVLADTVLRYDITAAPKFAQGGYSTTVKGKTTHYTIEQASQQIAEATGGNTAAILKKLTASKTSLYANLIAGVDVAGYQKIESLGISWLYPVRQTARTYPNGSVAGNLIGFVNGSGAQTGLELAYDKCLAGTNGSQTYERGLDGVKLPGSTTTTKKAHDGGTLMTTIDADLQYQMQQDLDEQVKAIGASSGTVTVIKVADGSILADADSSSTDPNNPGASNTAASFQSNYEPGSVFKAMTAASLIDSGLASPASQAIVADRRDFSWGGFIGDAESHPVEHLTLAGILADSSNVGISYMGEKMSAQERYAYMLKFGLGKKSEVNFPLEGSGSLGNPNTWDKQTNYNSMFGQGVSATAVQVASIFQTLANGGVREPLKLVKGCRLADGTVIDTPTGKATRVVSDKAATDVVQMLENTIPEGTLQGMVPISGYNVSAKTGTAQIADRPGGGYGDDYIISVAGIAPSEDPQYVVLITFTKPTTLKTSFAAAPAFREIMSQVLETYRVKPSTVPAANLPDTW